MKEETKIKKWNLKRWKQEAWKYCSIYNRKKDIDRFTGKGRCCTCFKVIHWAEGDAGHFQGGRKNAILFYDKGIHLQCKECNGPGNGEQYRYGLYIQHRYGLEEVAKQQKLKRESKLYTKLDYQNIVEGYKKKIAEL